MLEIYMDAVQALNTYRGRLVDYKTAMEREKRWNAETKENGVAPWERYEAAEVVDPITKKLYGHIVVKWTDNVCEFSDHKVNY